MRWMIYTSIALLGICLNTIILTDVLAQRGGGGRGGGGRGGGGQGGGPRGLGDLQSSGRQSPFADLPWDAQKLLEANRPTLQKIPRPLQGFIIASVKNWDHLFPIRKQQFELFFEKAKRAERKELIEAFQEAMPSELRNRPSNRGQRQSGPEIQGERPRQGRGQRQGGGQRQGRGQNATVSLTGQELTNIDRAFQEYVLPDQDTTPGIVLICLTGDKKRKAFDEPLTQQGTFFTQITMPAEIDDALATLQTGHPSAQKGKTLRAPSLAEYVNHTLSDKTHHRTLTFFQTPNPPPLVSKTKGYGKKYGPLSLKLDRLSDTAKKIEQELSKAAQQGKSDRYIELMIKPKLTPEALKIGKIIKAPPLQYLTLQTLKDDPLSRQLGSAFIQAVTNRALIEGIPDILISQFDKDDNTPSFLAELVRAQQTQARYQNGSALAIVDHSTGQALLLGNAVKTNTTIDRPHPLEDLTATVAELVRLRAPHIQGAVIADISTKP
jgi:hypothetical protein